MVLSGLVFESYYISIHTAYWSVLSQERYIYNNKKTWVIWWSTFQYVSMCCMILHVSVISQEFEKCCELYITLVHKGYRIVCSTVQLHSYDSLYKVNSVMNNAMYLRTASQCVSILHSVTETMTFWYKKISQSLYHHRGL